MANAAPYYHTHTKTLLTGAVGLSSMEVKFPNGYSKCIGVLVYPNTSTFTVKLGLKQGQTVVQELTHPDDWVSSNAVAYAQRSKPIEFRADIALTVSMEPLAALGADETWDMVFLLV